MAAPSAAERAAQLKVQLLRAQLELAEQEAAREAAVQAVRQVPPPPPPPYTAAVSPSIGDVRSAVEVQGREQAPKEEPVAKRACPPQPAGPRPAGLVTAGTPASSSAGSEASVSVVTGMTVFTKDGSKVFIESKEPGEKEFVKKDHPQWPKVACSKCGDLYKWQLMLQESIDVDDNSWTWQYSCCPCMSKVWQLSEGEAQVRIFQSRPGWEKKQGKIKAFNEAKQNRMEEFPMMKGKALYQMARQDLMQLFAPMASVILRKMRALNHQVELNERHKELLSRLKEAKRIGEARDLLDEIEKLAEEIEALSGYEAFRERAGGDKEVHRQFVLAAEYGDQWTQIYDKKNRLIGGIMSWFLCMGNIESGYAKCATTVGSKRWLMKHPDALAKRQAWYCPSCHGKYKASWGLIMEMTLLDGSRAYVRSEVDDRALDCKAMMIEQEMEQKNPSALSSPHALYDALPEVFPWVGKGSLWRPAAVEDLYWKSGDPTGVFKSTEPWTIFEKIPWMKWEQVLRFFEEEQ
jgi:hypothetical protein